MTRLRLGILLLFIILPPFFYLAGVHFLERYAGAHFHRELEKTYIGDVSSLLDGSQALKSVVRRNVKRYLDGNFWVRAGCHVTITIKTLRNELLFPAYDLDDPPMAGMGPQPMEIAAENYRLIAEGPEVVSTLLIPHASALAVGLLAVCLIGSLGGISAYFIRWQRRHSEQIVAQTEERMRLSQLSEQHQRKMIRLETERSQMAQALKEMQAKLTKEKDRATASEEEMIEEIVSLEEKIERNVTHQEMQRDEILQLQEHLDRIAKKSNKAAQGQDKSTTKTRKRLKTLYKNIDMHDRAISGYLNLAEELKLKCEEIILQLDRDPSKVKIKRKVFGKKNRATVLEVVFGYKGRLYYRLQANHLAEILVIGTKNSQTSDLIYLDRL